MSVQDTSLNAYHSEVLPTLDQRQQDVYNVLKASPEPLTNTEIAKRLGWSINRVTPRIFEMRADGVVIDAGKRPCSETGRTCYQWLIAKETLF